MDDNRRLTGGIAFIAFIVAVGGLAYYDATTARRTTDTAAFAPAQSADESVPVPDTTTPPDTMAAAAPDAAAPAPPADAAAPGPDVAMVKPTDTPPADVPPAATPPLPGAMVPSFDVVRVEPSGEAVIAGQAEPKSKVEVLDGTTTIATAEANENGEWAMALDKPLAPGPHDLALRTTSQDQKTSTLSDQRVTISVPDTGSKDVLVVMNTPDSASKILQVPGTPPAGEGTASGTSNTPGEQVAAAPAPEGTTAAPAAQGTGTGTGSGTGNTPGEQVAMAPPAEGTTAPAAEGTSSGTGNTPGERAAVTAMEPPIPTEPPAASEPKVAMEAPLSTEPPVKTEQAIPGEPDVVAKVEPPLAPPPAPKPAVAVAAVEADTAGSLYVAGTVATGETVRVYIDDKPIGDAKPSPSGTWLVETQRDMPAGNYTVRADQVDIAGNVIARSEVPFEREVEVAILKPTGTAGSQASAGATLAGSMPAMETVIIKRGDNLWRIARGAWGKGVRWSTIYQANTDQIRDPHWIYPGQVFLMPKGSTTWTD